MAQPTTPWPPQYPTTPPNPAQPSRKKPSWITSKPVIALAAGVIGLALGAGATRSGTTSAGVPAPTATVTVTASSEPTYQPEPTEESATDSAFIARRSDFKVGIKILTKKCFGSAGCNVTFRIKPTYVGTQELPESGTVEVTYKVKGGEDPLSNTFTIEDGEASYDSEEFISTRTSSAKLTAVVTEVTHNEW